MRAIFSKTRMNWASVLGVLCIALVLVSGMVQAAHFHPSGQPDHDCALCLAAHQAAKIAPPITLNLSGVTVAPVTPERALSRPQPAVFFQRISRPPPSGSVAAV